MAAHGYLHFVKRFLSRLDHDPSVMEIGVDRGVTFLTLTTFLARTRDKFLSVGIDIKVQDSVGIMLINLDLVDGQEAFLVENNSLAALEGITKLDKRPKFDVVMLDGDHNYYTVSKELEFLNLLVADGGIIIADDYLGRWSERDLYYSERDDYADVKLATKRIETEKHGVKPAVDDFVSANPEWKLIQPIKGEPVLLYRDDTALDKLFK